MRLVFGVVKNNTDHQGQYFTIIQKKQFIKAINQKRLRINCFFFLSFLEHRKLSQYPRYTSKLIIYDHI